MQKAAVLPVVDFYCKAFDRYKIIVNALWSNNDTTGGTVCTEHYFSFIRR